MGNNLPISRTPLLPWIKLHFLLFFSSSSPSSCHPVHKQQIITQERSNYRGELIGTQILLKESHKTTPGSLYPLSLNAQGLSLQPHQTPESLLPQEPLELPFVSFWRTSRESLPFLERDRRTDWKTRTIDTCHASSVADTAELFLGHSGEGGEGKCI